MTDEGLQGSDPEPLGSCDDARLMPSGVLGPAHRAPSSSTRVTSSPPRTRTWKRPTKITRDARPRDRRGLHLAPKTVENHVGAVFRKLGLAERPDDHRRVLAVLTFLRNPSP